MSSGRPAFFTGWAIWPFCATMAAIWSATSLGMPKDAPKMEVAIRPGQMAFTRMPCGVSWAAATRLIVDDPSLGGGIGQGAITGLQTGDGGGVDDGSAAAL